MQSDTGAKVVPPPVRVCIVVKDIKASSAIISELWGIGPWQTKVYSPGKDEIIVGEPFKLKATQTKFGSTTLELLQPLEGRSVLSEFLETNGEGIHHLAWRVPNYEETLSKVQEEDGRVLLSFIHEGKRRCLVEAPTGMNLEFEES